MYIFDLYAEKEIPLCSMCVKVAFMIWEMFDRIANRYDLLNRLLSLRNDVKWRKKIACNLSEQDCQKILDIATGTADVLLALFQNSDKPAYGIGVDMAKNMLKIGRNKIKHLGNIHLFPADALNLPFPSQTFDAVTIAFGIRNIPQFRPALAEMYRVLKPRGKVIILEFSLPQNFVIRTAYLYYFRKILPRIGGLVSGDYQAYRYLNASVEAFPFGCEFAEILRQIGFSAVKVDPLTFGIASVYSGEK